MLEYELIQKTLDYCGNCLSLGDCVLPAKGWLPVPPTEEEKQMYQDYNGVPWKYRKCPHLLRAESEKQQAAAMSGKWQERTLESFQVTSDNKEAYEAAVEYAKTLNPFTEDGLMFMGDVGTGKTHLAAGILKVAYNRGLDGVLISVPDLLNEIRDGYKDGRFNEKKFKEKFLVILDDLGTEKPSEWVREMLFTLINYRYENKKPLIVTTNCTPSELIEQLGKRTADRLREMCKVVKIEGKSWRGRRC